MEIFGQFGIEPFYLVAQIVNFLLLVYILKRLLYKPVLAMLKARQDKIRAGLAAGEKGEKMLADAEIEEKEIIKKASDETREMMEQAKLRLSKMEEEMLAEAKNEGEKMLAAAKDTIEQERIAAEKEVEKKVSAVAVSMLEHILPTVLTKQDQLRIISSSTKALEKAL